jgi:exopolyphosphatase/guanosine-5'-triphosphate,3'-diphosphate pyrophosphatase
MTRQPPIILEFGSQSLKVHYQSQKSGVFRKVRFAWDLGHEVYSTGKISERTARTALETIQSLRERGFEPRNLLAIATGALRDAENRKGFLELLEDKLGVEVRVISGREEASLLAQGYLRHYKKLPALITDIGGGSLEIVYLGSDKTILRDSLPLGAIRLHHLGFESSKSALSGVGAPGSGAAAPWDEALVMRFIESNLGEATLLTADEVYTTGGTGKALAKVLGKTEFTGADLEGLLAEVRRNGPPAGLAPDRALVFLPGVLVLRLLLRHSNARTLTYVKIPAGRIFLERMVQRTANAGHPDRKRFMLQNLRITTIHPKTPSGTFPAPPSTEDGEAD